MTQQEQAAVKLKRIMDSPILWCRYFLKIVDKQGQLVPFRFNPEQRQLIGNMGKYNIVLKSRQLGITSVACALSLYYCHVERDTVCILVSYSQDSARGIFDKLKTIYREIPDGIRMEDVANNRSELKFANGSRILVCCNGSKDVARGLTVKFVHLSEYAFFESGRARKNLLAIEQALRPDGKIIVESTANGLNHFSELWSKAESGDNMYKPFFFGWITDKRMFAAEYIEFCNHYKRVNGKLPELNELSEQERSLMNIGASLEQIVWRRLKIANSSEEEFRQEFPANPLEAFVTTGRNVFSAALIHDLLANIQASIKAPEQFMSYPLTFWKLPQAGVRYFIGVDVSEGVGLDKSVIEVLDEDCCQCAELYSDTIKPYRLAELLLALAIYYNSALCVIEKASAGHIVVDKMRNDYRYSNLYKSKQYDGAGFVRKRAGWITDAKSRPLMIGDFIELFENGRLWINSKTLFSEMKTFVAKESGRTEHEGKTGDDCVIAFALALQGVKSGVWYA